MSDMEKRVHDAFDAVHAPERVKASTFALIEAKRAELADSFGSSEPSDFAATAPQKHAAFEERAVRDAGEMERRPRGARTRKAGRGFRLLGAKIAVAACLLLAAVGVGGFAVATPTAYVGIDVNPSIELGINRFDHVVETKAYNDDGQAVLDQAQVQGMAYADALAAIESGMAEQGYIAQDSVVEVNVVCDDDSRYASIESACLNCFSGSGSGAHCSRATADDHHAASSCGMGMGKYRAYQALSDAGVDITAEEASNMTMRELYDLGTEAGVDIEWGCGSGHGAGHGAGNGNGSPDGSGAQASDDCDDDGAGAAGQGSGQGQGLGQGAGRGHGQGHGSGHGAGGAHE